MKKHFSKLLFYLVSAFVRGRTLRSALARLGDALARAKAEADFYAIRQDAEWLGLRFESALARLGGFGNGRGIRVSSRSKLPRC